jgi:hypothetical protein
LIVPLKCDIKFNLFSAIVEMLEIEALEMSNRGCLELIGFDEYFMSGKREKAKLIDDSRWRKA